MFLRKRSTNFDMSEKSASNGDRSIFRLLALLLLGLVVGYLTAERKWESKKLPAELCMSSGCVHTANIILQSMNRSVDPCEDFYGYICGNYKYSKLIPLNTSSWQGSLWDERYEKYFLSVLKSKAESEKVFSQAKMFYEACTKYTNKKELIQDEIIADIVKRIGHYPELGVNSRKFDLTDALIAMSGLDFFVFLKLEVIRNPLYRFNGSVTPILNSHVPFSKEYNRTVFLKHHKTIVAEVISVFNLTTSNLDMPAVDKITQSLLRFYNTSLKKFPQISEDPTLLNFTVGEAQKAIPTINITRFFMGQSHPNSTLKISDSTVIPSYMSLNDLERLNQILEEAGTDVLRHVFLDVMWSYIGKNTVSAGSCYRRVQNYFVAPISSLFGRLYTKPEEKAVVKEMVDDILETTIEVLQESNWMDETTREYAADKARKMCQCIAYPDEWLDYDKMAEDFEYLDLKEGDTYVEMTRKLNLLKTHIVYKSAFRRVDRSLLCTTTQTSIVNAYYYRSWNTFIILSGIIQEPLFDYMYPKIYFYATIGTVVAHEIMHGFDSVGRDYDSDGQEADWWSKNSREEYDKRKDCFIDQYNRMSSNGFRENGTNSITENIADNAGLSIAIRAITRRVERKPENRVVLPGLHNFSPEQTFFLSFGQLWCSVATESYMKVMLNDIHAFFRSRINGPVTNHREFAEAFQCRPGSNHNPNDEDRCILW